MRTLRQAHTPPHPLSGRLQTSCSSTARSAAGTTGARACPHLSAPLLGPWAHPAGPSPRRLTAPCFLLAPASGGDWAEGWNLAKLRSAMGLHYGAVPSRGKREEITAAAGGCEPLCRDGCFALHRPQGSRSRTSASSTCSAPTTRSGASGTGPGALICQPPPPVRPVSTRAAAGTSAAAAQTLSARSPPSIRPATSEQVSGLPAGRRAAPLRDGPVWRGPGRRLVPVRPAPLVRAAAYRAASSSHLQHGVLCRNACG